jgi:D-methionine transport system ATP-binding protein
MMIDIKNVSKTFRQKHAMTVPQELHQQLRPEYAEGLTPLIELELTGNISFDELIDTVYNHFKIPYKLIKADIEYLGKTSFGKLLLHLKGTVPDNEKVVQYFNKRKIKNAIKGYA